MTLSICVLAGCLVSGTACGQADRFAVLEQRLRDLSQNVPGLAEKTETSISTGSLQEFLKGLAALHNLNLSVDPVLNQKVTSYFSNEKVYNVLVYTARQYNLDFTFTGSIISVFPYKDPLAGIPLPIREVQVEFNADKQLLSLDLQNDSLLTVAKKITQLTNTNIVVLPELFPRKITAYLQGLPLQAVIEKMAISNNFKYSRSSDNTYVLEALKSDEEVFTRSEYDPNSNMGVRKNNKAVSGGPSSSMSVVQDNAGRKLVSLNVSNAPTKEVIKNISEQAGINHFIYSDIIGNSTATVRNMEYDKVLAYLLQGTRYTYTNVGQVYMIGERKDEGLRSHKLIQLKFRSVDSLIAMIPQEFRQNVEIKEFKELNSFLLSGSLPQINEIESFVTARDQTEPKVMIEVILMDV